MGRVRNEMSRVQKMCRSSDVQVTVKCVVYYTNAYVIVGFSNIHFFVVNPKKKLKRNF